jgi:RND family efflux transporter MFP subunit
MKAFRTLRWLVPLLIIGGALGFRFFKESVQLPARESPAVPVRTLKPQYGELLRSLRLNGHTESESMVTVLPMVSGILQELSIEAGQRVRKDQVIARIDAQRYSLQLQQAEAAYLSAKASYERLAELLKSNATSKQNYDQAKGQYEAYLSQYELAQLQLSYTEVKSPIDGVVLVKHASLGSIAAPERPIATIGDISDLVVRAKVPEKYYEAFTGTGRPKAITLRRAEGGDYPGTIRRVSPFVSAETKNFEVTIAIGGKAETLRPGMFVSIDFELDRHSDVYTLPFAALSGGNTLWWSDKGIAAKEAYIPALASDTAFTVPPEWAERKFVVEGQYFLREGSKMEELE